MALALWPRSDCVVLNKNVLALSSGGLHGSIISWLSAYSSLYKVDEVGLLSGGLVEPSVAVSATFPTTE